MSRDRFKRTLGKRSGSPPLLVPRIEAHAARLEQLGDAWPDDADAQARMYKCVARLYQLDAVTIGGGGFLLSSAAWNVVNPGPGCVSARRSAVSQASLPALPDPAKMVESTTFSIARDVAKRVRSLLQSDAALTYVLPQPGVLLEQVGRPDAIEWANEVVAEAVRTLGPDEPDGIVIVGQEDMDPMIDSLLSFFGLEAIEVGRGREAGITSLSIQDVLNPSIEAFGWLLTTNEEIPADADPKALRDAFQRLRS